MPACWWTKSAAPASIPIRRTPGKAVPRIRAQARADMDDLHRRSIYTYIKRNVPPPSMMVFDMNERSLCTVKVNTSNTPLQALVLMDDPQFVEAYRGMATRALEASSDKTEQIKFVYRLAVRRNPTAEETKMIMRDYYEQEASRFIRSQGDADKFLSVGLMPADSSLDRIQVAGHGLGGRSRDEHALRLYVVIGLRAKEKADEEAR